MPLNIDEFKSQFADLLRPNLFEVEIKLPNSLKNNEDKLISCMAKSTSFPFGKVKFQENRRYGKKYNIVTNYDYDSISVNFLLDSNGKIIDLFKQWKNLIVTDDFKAGYFDSYKGEVTIRMFDRQLRSVYEVKLLEAYPSAISNISLDYDSTTSISNFEVTFDYTSIQNTYNGKDYKININEDLLKEINLKSQTIREQTVSAKLNQVIDLTNKNLLNLTSLQKSTDKLKNNISDLISDKLNSVNFEKLNTSFDLPLVGKINLDIGSMVENKAKDLASNLTNKINNTIQEKSNDLQQKLQEKYAHVKEKYIDKLVDSVNKRVSKIFNI